MKLWQFQVIEETIWRWIIFPISLTLLELNSNFLNKAWTNLWIVYLVKFIQTAHNGSSMFCFKKRRLLSDDGSYLIDWKRNVSLHNGFEMNTWNSTQFWKMCFTSIYTHFHFSLELSNSKTHTRVYTCRSIQKSHKYSFHFLALDTYWMEWFHFRSHGEWVAEEGTMKIGRGKQTS